MIPASIIVFLWFICGCIAVGYMDNDHEIPVYIVAFAIGPYSLAACVGDIIRRLVSDEPTN